LLRWVFVCEFAVAIEVKKVGLSRNLRAKVGSSKRVSPERLGLELVIKSLERFNALCSWWVAE